MVKKLIRILLPVFLLIFGLGVGSGIFYHKLEKERAAFKEEIDKLDRMTALLQKRYREQKAMEGQLKRAQARLETQYRGLQDDLTALEAERSGCLSDLEAALAEKEALAAKLAEAQSRNLEEFEKVAALERRVADLNQELAKTRSDHEEAIAKLNEEKDALEADLNKSLRLGERKLGRCETDNGKLVILAEEMLEAYKETGSGKTFMYSEPFTQIKKVELEHFLQEYRHKVEDLRRQKEDG